MKTQVWQIDENGTQQQLELDGPIQIDARSGVRPIAPTKDRSAIAVARVEPVRQTVAAVFVPDENSERVALGGVPLEAGLHGLRHADRLEVGGRPFWISVDARPEETQYDPARHGPDMFCGITTARLKEGDPITICPGVPGKSCVAIYRQQAWQRALDEPKPFVCPDCGFDPQQPPWTPPADQPRRSLDELFQIIAEQVEPVSP